MFKDDARAEVVVSLVSVSVSLSLCLSVLAQCGLIWDVYKVHREKKTMDWFKMTYTWVKLLFVAAGTTSKGQGLDVVVNAHVQSGSKQKVSQLQIEHIRAAKAKDPDATPIINLSTPVLRAQALEVARAGMAAARALGEDTLRGAHDKTGASAAWDPAFQHEAMVLHGQGKLFSGSRQEEEPYGQEMEPDDLEADAVALPASAPPKPKPSKASARDLFVLSEREATKCINGFKTLKLADEKLKEEWKVIMSL